LTNSRVNSEALRTHTHTYTHTHTHTHTQQLESAGISKDEVELDSEAIIDVLRFHNEAAGMRTYA
jgi:hypothetical protein